MIEEVDNKQVVNFLQRNRRDETRQDQSSVQHKCDWGSHQSLSDIKLKSGNCLYHLSTQRLVISGSAIALEIDLVLLHMT